MTIRIECDIDANISADNLAARLRELASDMDNERHGELVAALTELAVAVEGAREPPSGVRGTVTFGTPTEPDGELTSTELNDTVELIRKRITDAAGERGRLVELQVSLVVDVLLNAPLNEEYRVEDGRARKVR